MSLANDFRWAAATDTPMTSLSRQMATGIAWMSLTRVGVKGLGLVSTLALARLLVPADFGLIAMAMSVISAIELLRAFNFDVALIQNQQAGRSFYDTAWTLNILFGVLLAALVLAIAGPAAAFFSEPRLVSIMQVLALSTLISGFENIGVVAFRKDLTFHKEFALRVGQKLCGLAVTLPLAFALRNHWALVIGMITGGVSSVVISYVAHPFRPRLSFAAKSQLLSFSKWLLANNTVCFLRDRTPDFLIGRFAGSNALGVFSVSFEIASLPTTELVAPINRAVLPAYAKMAGDMETLRRGFLDVIGLVALLALPAGFGIAATSGLVVPIAFGDKWLAAVPLVSVLAIFGGLNALTTNCGVVHLALGRPHTLTFLALAQVAFLLPAVVVTGYYHGAIGVAWALLAYVVVLSVPMHYAVAMRTLELPLKRVLALFWRPAVATAAMYAATAATAARVNPTLGSLLAAVAGGAAVYGATLFLLWLAAGRPPGPEKILTERFVLPVCRRLVAGSTRVEPHRVPTSSATDVQTVHAPRS